MNSETKSTTTSAGPSGRGRAMAEEVQSQLPFSVKIERTAKGARWTVHCYGKDLEVAMNDAVQAYDEVGKRLEDRHLSVAPVGKGKNK